MSDDSPHRLSESGRRQLAATYAPILVGFPAGAGLNRPNGGHGSGPPPVGDYQPRPVDLALDHAYLYQGLWQALRHPGGLLRLHQSHPWLRHLPDSARCQLPAQEASARRQIPRLLSADIRLAFNAVIDLVGISRSRRGAERAWQCYLRLLAGDAAGRYRPRVYARVLQGDEVLDWSVVERLRWYGQFWAQVTDLAAGHSGPLAHLAGEIEARVGELAATMEEALAGYRSAEDSTHDVAVQYWFMYFYNDWHNRHEVDWETVTLILQAPRSGPVSPGTLEPLVAGYATHVSGRRRPWPAVQRQDTHPYVYAARGSHASYFRYRPQGYAAGLPIALKVPLLNVQITSQIRRGDSGYRDWVADPGWDAGDVNILHPQRDYDLQLLPNLNPYFRPDSGLDLHSLAWQIYPGYWGSRPALSIGGSGPRGPLWQGVKSDNPFKWVRRKCQADDRYSP